MVTMPDVKSIDSLSLKITSSTEEAVKALNNLENALVGVINATGGLKTASGNVDAFAKSMSGLASGLKSAITASKNMTFTQAEAEARELDKTINKVSKSSLAAFGVTNKKAIGDYRKALSDMVNEYRRTDDIDVSRITEQAKLLEDNSNSGSSALQRGILLGSAVITISSCLTHPLSVNSSQSGPQANSSSQSQLESYSFSTTNVALQPSSPQPSGQLDQLAYPI
jgi:hypothetical protein